MTKVIYRRKYLVGSFLSVSEGRSMTTRVGRRQHVAGAVAKGFASWSTDSRQRGAGNFSIFPSLNYLSWLLKLHGFCNHNDLSMPQFPLLSVEVNTWDVGLLNLKGHPQWYIFCNEDHALNPSQTVPLTGEQAFKHKSLWGPFSDKPPYSC